MQGMADMGDIGVSEQVARYPRPPAVRLVTADVRVCVGGSPVAMASRVVEVLETWHPPTVYLDPGDFLPGTLIWTPRTSFCEFKGRAQYVHVHTPQGIVHFAGWSYREPMPGFERIRGLVAVYPTLLECWMNGERVRGQEGGFYGGWITSRVQGPFKGDGGWNPDR